MESSSFKNTPVLFSYFFKLFCVFVAGHQLYFKTEVQLIYIPIFVLGDNIVIQYFYGMYSI